MFRDWNKWYLPLVEEEVTNHWAIVIPCTQFFCAVFITNIAVCIICAYDDAFNIVMNSMAFSFVGDIPEMFSAPLLQAMTSQTIKGSYKNQILIYHRIVIKKRFR